MGQHQGMNCGRRVREREMEKCLKLFGFTRPQQHYHLSNCNWQNHTDIRWIGLKHSISSLIHAAPDQLHAPSFSASASFCRNSFSALVQTAPSFSGRSLPGC